jgi:hypothetical protein
MPRRSKVIQDQVVARRMRTVFGAIEVRTTVNFARTILAGIPPLEFLEPPRLEPQWVAKEYGRLMWDAVTENVRDAESLSRSRFNVGIAADVRDLEFLTKRATLVSDTLLLSDSWTGRHIPLTDRRHRLDAGNTRLRNAGLTALDALLQSGKNVQVGMRCSDLEGLGHWLLDAKPLLKAGVAWYLPSYTTFSYRRNWRGEKSEVEPEQPTAAIDFLVRDRRAVDASDVEPIKSQLVRPVLRAELPFIEGVGLREFGKITVGEFNSFSAFRDFLRVSFLEMDESLNAVQSERELVKLGLHIKDHVRAAHAEMRKARRKRAIAVTGAVVGSVCAVLVAVYGPALAAAVTAFGAGAGSVWGVVHAFADNSLRTLREDKWHYVWVLDRNSRTQE